MDVPEKVRMALAGFRAGYNPFELAWPAAVADALDGVPELARDEWRTALEETRSTWQRCFEYEPAEPGDLAGVALD
jgi:hypothetical protein